MRRIVDWRVWNPLPESDSTRLIFEYLVEVSNGKRIWVERSHLLPWKEVYNYEKTHKVGPKWTFLANRIHGQRKLRIGAPWEYLVEWVGYPLKKDWTWETAENLDPSNPVLAAWTACPTGLIVEVDDGTVSDLDDED